MPCAIFASSWSKRPKVAIAAGGRPDVPLPLIASAPARGFVARRTSDDAPSSVQHQPATSALGLALRQRGDDRVAIDEQVAGAALTGLADETLGDHAVPAQVELAA